MRLNTLKIKNFKGIKSFTLDAQGKDVTISGENETGKTTIFDGFRWLLDGKDSNSRRDFEVKTLTRDGSPIHGLDHEIEAELDVDGRTITLKKTYREKWTKQRGSAEAVFSGHTIDHHIDGVPVKLTEYDAAIGAIAPAEVFLLLTDPRYFNTALHWQRRREILLEVCGDIEDNAVIASDHRLGQLPDILGSRTIDDHRKVIAEKRKEIQRELERIPIRIDEVNQSLPDTSAIDKMAHENNLRVLDELIASKEQRRTSLLGGGGVAELRKQIAEIDAAIAERKNELREAGAGDRHQIQNQKYTLQSEILRLQAEERDTAAAIATAKINRDQASEEVERERANWHAVNDTEPAIDDTTTTCPACRQDLPAEQIALARETALATFNQDKAQKLGAITEQGKAAKRRADEAIEKIAKLDQALAGTIAVKLLHAAELQEIEATIAAQIATTTDPADDLPYKVLTAQKAQTEIELGELTRSSSAAIAAVDEEIAAKKAARVHSTEALQKLERHAQGGIRISQLKSQETKLATEYEKLEQELYLTEEFIKTKVELLEEKINRHFEHARFKMFNTFIAGGIEPTCETLYNGVPYGSNLNNGARINVGLDIIRTLSRHYSVEAPIFIDNAEAITQLIETPAQMIKLYHIPGIKELEVVVEQPATLQEKK